MSDNQKSIQKKFELERLILFSDAVFAIAITLLIIEIKFPDIPKGATSSEIWHLCHHLGVEFFTFIISFFFIGMFWAKHLKLCRHLKTYNDGVIFRNLFFLFFIVTFPFSASSIGHARPSFMFPTVVYIFNICMVGVTHHLFTTYILKRKPQLSIPGNDADKKYILMQSSFFMWMLISLLLCTIFILLVFPGNNTAFSFIFIPAVIGSAITKRRLKKYKPVSSI